MKKYLVIIVIALLIMPVSCIKKTENLVLGTWESKVKNTVYQAPTDGFLITTVFSNGGGLGIATIKTDSSSSPTTIRARVEASRSGAYQSVTVPIRKGDYYEVTEDNGTVSSIDWMPLGT